MYSRHLTSHDGYIRARNDVLQPDEVPRGISARLDIAEDGLLKPEAVVSDRVETVSGDSPHKDAVSRSSPRIGLDTENIEGVDDNLIAINTEAHSLHTDRGVGQRVVLQGGFTTASQTIGNYDLTELNFGGQPQGGAVRMSHTSNFNPLGGTYIAEARNFVSPIDDTNWGGFTDATCHYDFHCKISRRYDCSGNRHPCKCDYRRYQQCYLFHFKPRYHCYQCKHNTEFRSTYSNG